MKGTLFFFFTSLFCISVHAQTKISGVVQDSAGKVLSFSSVMIKGSSKGTTANNKGYYQIVLTKGSYTLVCRQLGYKTAEQKIIVKDDAEQTINFNLATQQYELKEVVVSKGGEDPAYPIIRQAIKQRPVFLNELKRFECEVYIKGELKLRDFPKKFFGEKVDFEDGDTSKRKILLLSESVAKYSVDGDKKKTEVVSTKVSGSSDGFGFSSPQIISFYENNISVGTNLNPRGFISPISTNALNYYNYHFMGSYYENGKEISQIKVMPKRKYEPLFTGYINIIENEWRLQSVHLTLLKEQQIQIVDTLTIDQLFVPYKKIWVIKQQTVFPSGKLFGFDFYGNFLQIYDKFNTEPSFAKKFFDNTILVFKDSSNKKSKQYWDTTRPVPLSPEEQTDYIKKDSLEKVRSAPAYLDSLDKIHNKITPMKLFFTGLDYEKQKRKITAHLQPLATSLDNINTVEGIALTTNLQIEKHLKGRESVVIAPNIRYGTTNHHFNASLKLEYHFGKKYINNLSVEGGKQVFQFNNQNPISAFGNSWATLYYGRNYMKLYQANYFKFRYTKGLGDGINCTISTEYQDRLPLENTNTYHWRTVAGHSFTPNCPIDIAAANIARHQALSFTAGISFTPGNKYIEFPDQKISIGSKYPVFNLSLTQGIPNVLGSTVNYTKWKASITGKLNLKLAGKLLYRTEVGGFINSNQVYTPDYTHYLGNQTAIATKYLEGFQLLPYYALSNTANFYSTANIEYHLNGFITNKIPVFKKLNWFFVIGGNALLIQPNTQFYECFFSIENIFKVARVDAVQAFTQHEKGTSGIRVSLPLLSRGGRGRR